MTVTETLRLYLNQRVHLFIKTDSLEMALGGILVEVSDQPFVAPYITLESTSEIVLVPDWDKFEIKQVYTDPQIDIHLKELDR